MAIARPRTLSALFVKEVTEIGRYGDGRGGLGLSLLVKPTKTEGVLSKCWAQRITVNGKTTNRGLGSYPSVTLQEARMRVIENAQTVASRGCLPPRVALTFRAAVEKAIEERQLTWRDSRGASIWRSSLERYAYPVIGDKLLLDITAQDIADVVRPHWDRCPETMRRVKQRIGVVLDWAVNTEHLRYNPAHAVHTLAEGSSGFAHLPDQAYVFKVPPPQPGGHSPQWLPPGEIPSVVTTIENSGASQRTILGVRFLILTAAASGQVRQARWWEMDREKRLWVVPESRTRIGAAQRVPLSEQAIEVLEEAGGLWGADTLVFPSPRGKVASSGSFSDLFRKNGIGCSPHGIRHSFGEWGVAKGVSWDTIKHTLGRPVKVESLYPTPGSPDRLEGRVSLMQDWADHVTGRTVAFAPVTSDCPLD